VVKDYIIKKPYKIIDFHGEFDQELRYAVPFAYWHYLNGTLAKTISYKNTKDLYFFSKNHEERQGGRDWELGYKNFEIPNMTHSINFSYKKWKRVPWRDIYQNDMIKFEKPILLIANKYNMEWDLPPLNFLDIPTLDSLVLQFREKYQIIYNRPLNNQITTDNSDILDLNEYKWLTNKYPEVILMNDLFETYREKVNNFNHLQLMVYANCNHFISVHGGTAALASCFGGQNIILSKKGIEHHLNEFDTIIPSLSGAKIYHAKSENMVLEYARQFY